MAKKFILSRLLFRNGNKKSSSNAARNDHQVESTKKKASYSTKSSSSSSSTNKSNKDQVTDSILKVSKQKQQQLLSLLKYSNADRDMLMNGIPPDQQSIYLLRLYLATVQKLKRYQPNSMEKQKAVYGLLSCLVIQQELDRFDAEFEPVGRKPRKTRYISTLLDTPVESITPFHHPVLEANKRKPFVETFHVIMPSSPSESSFSSSTVSLTSTASSSTLTSSPPSSIKTIGSFFHSSSSFPPYKQNNRPSWFFSSTNSNYPQLHNSLSVINLSPPPILPRASSFTITPHSHLPNVNTNDHDHDNAKNPVSHHHHLWTSRSDPHLHASFGNHLTAVTPTEDEDDIPLAVLRTRKVVDRPLETNPVHVCC